MATRQRRDRSDSVDKELTDLFRVALESNNAVGKEIALIAVGGYGRAELSPGSDLDIVILDRKSTRLNSSHMSESRMPSSA